MGFFSQRFSVDTVPCVHTMLGLVVQRLRSIVPVVHHTEQAFDVQHKFMLPGCVRKKKTVTCKPDFSRVSVPFSRENHQNVLKVILKNKQTKQWFFNRKYCNHGTCVFGGVAQTSLHKSNRLCCKSGMSNSVLASHIYDYVDHSYITGV